MYSESGSLYSSYCSYDNQSDNDIVIGFDDLLRNWNHKNTKTYSAPTQILLQKWLREVHKIDIFMSVYGTDTLIYHARDIIKHENNDTVIVGDGGKGSVIYEEALEIGLYNALELI